MTLQSLLTLAVEKGASDLHLKVGAKPYVRVAGLLMPLFEELPTLSNGDLEYLLKPHLNNTLWESFLRRGDLDFSFGLPQIGRFRVNLSKQRDTLRVVIRHIPDNVPDLSKLHLPPSMQNILKITRGMVLITGATGSGKSTTVASLINELNREKSVHILTIEDPIEFLIPDQKGFITQRELGVDARSFAKALRSGLRQDPDIIFVGEMRDRETIETALLAAETGHLVFSTLHTLDATETIHRIISMFEPQQQFTVRLQLASVLKGIVSQRMCRRKGGSYVPAVEILLNNARVRQMIENPEKTGDIPSAIAEGTDTYGMQSFDQSLTELLMQDLITMEEAVAQASNPDDFKVRIQGIVAMDGKKWAEATKHSQNLMKRWRELDEVELETKKQTVTGWKPPTSPKRKRTGS